MCLLFVLKCLTFCLMHSFCLCHSLMDYKQAVSGFIYTHHSSFIFHARRLFTLASFRRPPPFPQNLWSPFIPAWRWANETHSRSCLMCTHTHTHFNIGWHFSFLKRKKKAHQRCSHEKCIHPALLWCPPSLTVGYTLPSLILSILEQLLKIVNFRSLNSCKNSSPCLPSYLIQQVVIHYIFNHLHIPSLCVFHTHAPTFHPSLQVVRRLLRYRTRFIFPKHRCFKWGQTAFEV